MKSLNDPNRPLVISKRFIEVYKRDGVFHSFYNWRDCAGGMVTRNLGMGDVGNTFWLHLLCDGETLIAKATIRSVGDIVPSVVLYRASVATNEEWIYEKLFLT